MVSINYLNLYTGGSVKWNEKGERMPRTDQSQASCTHIALSRDFKPKPVPFSTHTTRLSCKRQDTH